MSEISSIALAMTIARPPPCLYCLLEGVNDKKAFVPQKGRKLATFIIPPVYDIPTYAFPLTGESRHNLLATYLYST